MVERIKTLFEYFAFGVCEWMGDRLRIKSARIRLFFIYASFMTIGSPLILYMAMAFLLNLRRMIRNGRGNAWDL
jgi:phage shock protein PspC (stress-responsive transcriptional regulator)